MKKKIIFGRDPIPVQIHRKSLSPNVHFETITQKRHRMEMDRRTYESIRKLNKRSRRYRVWHIIRIIQK